MCLFVYMTEHGVIRSDRVFEAMLATDRGIYSRDNPYEDSPQSIGVFIVKQICLNYKLVSRIKKTTLY